MKYLIFSYQLFIHEIYIFKPMKQLIKTSAYPTLLIRLTVGLIFLSEGIQKYLVDSAGTGRFSQIGFNHPAFWAYFTGIFEIVCGLSILIGFLTRFASVPLLIIMATAFVTTKWPILMSKGFWAFAHEYRTDFAMTMLLAFLLIYGGDQSFFRHKKRQ